MKMILKATVKIMMYATHDDFTKFPLQDNVFEDAIQEMRSTGGSDEVANVVSTPEPLKKMFAFCKQLCPVATDMNRAEVCVL